MQMKWICGWLWSRASSGSRAAGFCGLCVSRIKLKVRAHRTVLPISDVMVNGRLRGKCCYLKFRGRGHGGGGYKNERVALSLQGRAKALQNSCARPWYLENWGRAIGFLAEGTGDSASAIRKHCICMWYHECSFKYKTGRTVVVLANCGLFMKSVSDIH